MRPAASSPGCRAVPRRRRRAVPRCRRRAVPRRRPCPLRPARGRSCSCVWGQARPPSPAPRGDRGARALHPRLLSASTPAPGTSSSTGRTARPPPRTAPRRGRSGPPRQVPAGAGRRTLHTKPRLPGHVGRARRPHPPRGRQTTAAPRGGRPGAGVARPGPARVATRRHDLTLYTAGPGTASEDRLRLLAGWAATQPAATEPTVAQPTATEPTATQPAATEPTRIGTADPTVRRRAAGGRSSGQGRA